MSTPGVGILWASKFRKSNDSELVSQDLDVYNVVSGIAGIICAPILLPRTHAQGVKQSVCLSVVVVVVVVVVGTKIARSRVLGICMHVL